MATPPTTWVNKPVAFVFVNELEQLINVFNELSESVSSILTPISVGLSAAKIFLVDEINPLLLAIAFVIEQMLTVITNLRNSGVYSLVMYPGEETHSKWRSDKTSAIVLADIVGGFGAEASGSLDPVIRAEAAKAATESFFLLSRDDCFQFYVDSFEDLADANRPPGPGIKQITTINVNGKNSLDFVNVEGNSAWFRIWTANSASTVPGDNIPSNSGFYHVWFNINNLYDDPSPPDTLGGIEVKLNTDDTTEAHVISQLKNAINSNSHFSAFDEESGLIVVTNTLFGPSAVSTDGVPTGLQFGVRTNGIQGVSDNATTGGIIIFAGAMTSDILKQGTYVKDIVQTFCDLSDTFLSLLDLDSLRGWHNNCVELKRKIDEAEDAARRGGILQPKVLPNKTVKPDWKATKLVEVFPPMDDLLSSIEGILLGIQKQSTGANTAMTNLITYIDNKIAEIAEIIEEITDFIQFLEDLNTKLNRLGTFELNTLVIESQPGGLTEIKRAIMDDSIPNRPSQDLFYCSLISLVGTGTAFNFLMYTLGLSDSFTTGADDTAFDSDELKERYNID